IVLRGVVKVFDPPALARAPPEVVVDRIRDPHLRAALDLDPMLARVGDLLLASHLPAANGGDDLRLRGKRGDRGLDPDLVVAFAGAAVGDRVATRLARNLDR